MREWVRKADEAALAGTPAAASAEYVEALEHAGIVQSMSRKGNCWDNVVAESFFGTPEQELGSRARWASVAQARDEVGRSIHAFYNVTRPHSTIGFHRPVANNALHRASITEAAQPQMVCQEGSRSTDEAFFARTGDVPCFLMLVARLVDRPPAEE